MKPATFNNAMVATVSAYAEALGESVQLAEQLQQALAQAARTASPRVTPVLAAARAVVAAAPDARDAMIEQLRVALHRHDGGDDGKDRG